MNELLLFFLIIFAAAIYVNYTSDNLRTRKMAARGGITVRELTTKNNFKKCEGLDNLGGYDMPTDANAY
jgi:hypothetical protein